MPQKKYPHLQLVHSAPPEPPPPATPAPRPAPAPVGDVAGELLLEACERRAA